MSFLSSEQKAVIEKNRNKHTLEVAFQMTTVMSIGSSLNSRKFGSLLKDI